MSRTPTPSPEGLQPNVVLGGSCAFMDQIAFTPCNQPAHWRQKGSGIPLCDAHAVIVTKAKGRCTALKPEVSARPSMAKVG